MITKSPYDDITPESIKADMLLDLEGRMSTGEGSYANLLVSEAAWQLYKAYQQVPHLLAMAFPGPDAGPYIDMAAGVVGMTRETGAKATVEMSITGRAGTRLPTGTGLYAPESGLRYQLTAEVVLTGGTVRAMAEAQEMGSVYNLPAGAITAMEDSVPGVDRVTNEAAAVGGADPESDEALWTRWHQRMSCPATSGNPAHYVQWALEIPGVACASCEPLWSGAGTVRVILGGAERDPVDEGVRQRCEAHIRAERPIGAAVTVASCRTLRISLRATVTPMPGVSLDQVRRQLTERVAVLLESLPFGTAQKIPTSRFLACLLACPGVADYSHFEVVGASGHELALQSLDSPVVGTVTIS